MALRVTTSNQHPETTQRDYPSSPFRFFEEFLKDWARSYEPREGEAWRPPVDVLEKDGNLILKMEIPGVNESDIDIKLENSLLTIHGEKQPQKGDEKAGYHRMERWHGNFSRSFTLPETVDGDRVSADYKNGILTVTLPGKPETRPRLIKINA